MTSALLICPTYLVLQHFTGTAYKVREPGLYTATYVDVRLSRESSLFRLACTAMTYRITSPGDSERELIGPSAERKHVLICTFPSGHQPSQIQCSLRHSQARF